MKINVVIDDFERIIKKNNITLNLPNLKRHRFCEFNKSILYIKRMQIRLLTEPTYIYIYIYPKKKITNSYPHFHI
jgi:hypothetical protein